MWFKVSLHVHQTAARLKQRCPACGSVSEFVLCWHKAGPALGVPIVSWFTEKTTIALFKAYYLGCNECGALFRIDKRIADYLIAKGKEPEDAQQDSAAAGDGQTSLPIEQVELAHAVSVGDDHAAITTANGHIALQSDVNHPAMEQEATADATATAPSSVMQLRSISDLTEQPSATDGASPSSLGEVETDGCRTQDTPANSGDKSHELSRSRLDLQVKLRIAITSGLVVGPLAYLLGLHHGGTNNVFSPRSGADAKELAWVSHTNGDFESEMVMPVAELRGLPTIQDAQTTPTLDGGLITIPLPLKYWHGVSLVEARVLDQFRARDRWNKGASYIAAAVFRNPRAEAVKAEIYVAAQNLPFATTSEGSVAVNMLARWLYKQLEPRAIDKEVELLEPVSPLRVGDKVGVACAFREGQWSRQLFLMPHRNRLYVFELRVSGAELYLAKPQLWAVVNGTVLH